MKSLSGFTPCRGAKALALASGCLFLFSGCYKQVAREGSSVYRYENWVGFVVIAAGFVGILAGWLLKRWKYEWGMALLILSPVGLLIFAPDYYVDNVVVDSEHFEVRNGFWFAPRAHNIRYDEIKSIRCELIIRSRRPTRAEMHVSKKNGIVEFVAVDGLVRKAMPEILGRAREKRIPVKEW